MDHHDLAAYITIVMGVSAGLVVVSKSTDKGLKTLIAYETAGKEIPEGELHTLNGLLNQYAEATDTSTNSLRKVWWPIKGFFVGAYYYLKNA